MWWLCLTWYIFVNLFLDKEFAQGRIALRSWATFCLLCLALWTCNHLPPRGCCDKSDTRFSDAPMLCTWPEYKHSALLGSSSNLTLRNQGSLEVYAWPVPRSSRRPVIPHPVTTYGIFLGCVGQEFGASCPQGAPAWLCVCADTLKLQTTAMHSDSISAWSGQLTLPEQSNSSTCSGHLKCSINRIAT